MDLALAKIAEAKAAQASTLKRAIEVLAQDEPALEALAYMPFGKARFIGLVNSAMDLSTSRLLVAWHEFFNTSAFGRAQAGRAAFLCAALRGMRRTLLNH